MTVVGWTLEDAKLFTHRFLGEIEAYQDLLVWEFLQINIAKAKVYKLLENQNVSTKDCLAGDNKYPKGRNFVQEKDCEIYI